MTRLQAFPRASICVLLAFGLASACCRGARDEDERPKRPQTTQRPSRTPAGDPIVRLEPDAQARIGIRTQPAAVQTSRPELVAYGRLEEDPARAFVLRAPFAGTLHFAPGRDWPQLGESLSADAVVGTIEPRLTPAERIGFTSQLASARADLSALTSSLSAARAAYERSRILNADNKNVSDRTVEEAAARVAAEAARVKTATETVRLLESSLGISGPAGTRSLAVERGGEVVEIMAQPGEAIEPGAPVLRVARFDRLLARVDVPVGEKIPPSVLSARIVAVGYEDTPIPAGRVGVSPTAQPASQGQSFLFRLGSTVFGLRPGVAVTAHIAIPGPSPDGVVIPAAAIVRFGGQAYAFLQISVNEFVRKPVPLDRPVEGGYLSPANFTAGDRLVVQGAQLLLSEEFKSQIAAEADKG